MKLSRLEFSVFRRLQKYAGRKLLVAVSGGRDSVALLYLLLVIQKKLNLQLAVAHIHHGKTKKNQLRARDEARKLVRKLAKENSLTFFEAPEDIELPQTQSEAELRRYRHTALEKIRSENGFDLVAFAHHADDLFETRLVNLIRGTGPEGLRAMRLRSGKKLRPLLATSRAQLHEYFGMRGLFATTDPSNSDTGPLRNWLRLVWLNELEAKRPGSAKALQRSLALIVEALANSPSEITLPSTDDGALDRRVFDSLRPREKRLILALYLRRLRATNVSKSQIDEVIKRLDTYQKRLMFKVGPLNWSINAEQIRAEPKA